VIDGIEPARVAAPSTPQEMADFLANAAADSLAAAPIGAGSSLALGNVPERIDVALSTSKITGVISYEPTDLTLSVWAGSRFADVDAILAEHGQTLPIDVPNPSNATIGGLIATGLAGPRRTGSPTFRDLLIGISAAHPSGTVTKAGGMVVKNVTGFDLMRVYLGSLGTLGVIVSANFKVIPRARFEMTSIATFDGVSIALEAAERVRTSRARPVAFEVFQSNDHWQIALRLEGRESTVRLIATEIENILGTAQGCLEGDASKDWWMAFTERESATTSGQDAVLRCTTRPRLGVDLLQTVSSHLLQNGASSSHLSLSPSVGTVTARIAPGDQGEPRTSFAAMRASILAVADNVVVLAAPAPWKAGIDVWGKPPETLDIMKALKAEFDPGRVLNPGRFAGGI
jgi:glycolate oxidase FAD binding subunit